MSNPITPHEIQNWNPAGLDHFVGNAHIIEAFKHHFGICGVGENVLLSGETGSGKTAFIDVYLRTLNCSFAEDDVGRGPCGKCQDCCNASRFFDDRGLFARASWRSTQGKMVFENYRFNCSSFDMDALESLGTELRDLAGNVNIIVLDEVQELAGSTVEGSLMTLMKQYDAVWIASGTNTQKLRPEFVRRFSRRLRTKAPTPVEIAEWLLTRVTEWKIKFDEDSTLALLAHRCRGIVAETISVLAIAAATPDRTLTKSIVTDFPFINGCTSEGS